MNKFPLDGCVDHCSNYADLTRDAPRWIAIGERLPDKGATVMAYEPPIKSLPLAGQQTHFVVNFVWDRFIDPSTGDYVKATHWMPLPDGPK